MNNYNRDRWVSLAATVTGDFTIILQKIDVLVTPDCRGKTMLALVNPSRESQALSLNQEIQTRFLNIGEYQTSHKTQSMSSSREMVSHCKNKLRVYCIGLG